MKFGLQGSDSSSEDDWESPLPAPVQPRTTSGSARKSTPRATTRASYDLSTSIPSTSKAGARSDDKPFDPTPVHLVRPPNLKKQERRRRRPHANFDPDASTDLSGGARSARRTTAADVLAYSSSDDDDSDTGPYGLVKDDTDSDFDSEEEAWPVGPVNSIGVGGWRRPGSSGVSAASRKGKGRAYDTSERLFGGPDELEDWDAKARASSWATANRTFHLSLARSHSISPAVKSPSPAANEADIASIQSLLGQLALKQSQETAQLVQAFEQRNKALWDSIEASIREAEKEEGERQRILAEQRRKEEEAKRRAQELREAEEKRAREEKERQEAKRKEDEAKAEETRKRDEEERAKRAEEERKAAAKASALGLPGADAEGSPKSEFERWTAKMTHIKQSVLPVVSQNPAWRKACFQAKRSITPKIGQLTSSAEAITRIIAQLDQLLSSLKPPAGPPEPYTWTLNHLAKSLVKQAETEVTAKLGTAYPLGRVVVGLLARGHTELGDVLMARLVKKCFWLTGYWPPKQAVQTDEAYQKVLGHAPPTSSESLVQYAERMSGLVALYGSILQTSPLDAPQGPCPESALSNIPPHFRPAAGWRWLVLMLRPPLVGLEPTPLLLVTFLEIAGPGMLEVYGRQFNKYLEVLLREGMREGKAGFSEKAKSSTVRLLLWLEDWEKKGVVEGAPGRAVDP
ncbi:hypothetical protein JCM10908_001815 [Rhodotorula pacifica]|uniref:uncharacterized protein n=1 Tax=Rhodotorula pacifica TaxID=1495444 RepID=UPI00316EB123